MTLPLSCADCLEMWEPQPPGALRACPGIALLLLTTRLLCPPDDTVQKLKFRRYYRLHLHGAVPSNVSTDTGYWAVSRLENEDSNNAQMLVTQFTAAQCSRLTNLSHSVKLLEYSNHNTYYH
jgi:hypothetical protein